MFALDNIFRLNRLTNKQVLRIMNIKLKSMAVICGLAFMTGCIAYGPPPYSPYYGAQTPYVMQPQVAPYGAYGGFGGYGYGVSPVVSVPVFGFGGWGYRGFRH
jgi:hypothetical protein